MVGAHGFHARHLVNAMHASIDADMCVCEVVMCSWMSCEPWKWECGLHPCSCHPSWCQYLMNNVNASAHVFARCGGLRADRRERTATSCPHPPSVTMWHVVCHTTLSFPLLSKVPHYFITNDYHNDRTSFPFSLTTTLHNVTNDSYEQLSHVIHQQNSTIVYWNNTSLYLPNPHVAHHPYPYP